MGSKGKEATQKLLALIVIISMLGVMNIPPFVIVFFAVVAYFIWRAVQHSEQEDTTRIFKFYVRANDLLREEDKRWYGYEIEREIERGEKVFHSMTDPPPLVCFALGALYQRAGHHEAAIEHLAEVVENPDFDERQRFAPSPELRRYVRLLRKLEREPAEAPQTMAAVRSLERARRNRAADLLAQSREKLNAIAPQTAARLKAAPEQPALFADALKDNVIAHAPNNAAARDQNTPPPPSITEVLRDVYEEKKTA